MRILKIEAVCDARGRQRLAALERACFPDEAWTEEALTGFLAASIRFAYLLADAERDVGYVVLNHFAGEVEIERIGIVPQARSRYFGRTFLLEVLASLAVDRCVLEVSAANEAAVRMYRACGFAVFGCRPAYYHDGADALMMEWKRKNE